MNIDELKEKLKEIVAKDGFDEETEHMDADKALLDYINDDEVSELFDSIKKWYA